MSVHAHEHDGKLRDALLNLEPRVELPDDLIARALVPLERMLAIK